MRLVICYCSCFIQSRDVCDGVRGGGVGYCLSGRNSVVDRDVGITVEEAGKPTVAEGGNIVSEFESGSAFLNSALAVEQRWRYCSTSGRLAVVFGELLTREQTGNNEMNTLVDIHDVGELSMAYTN